MEDIKPDANKLKAAREDVQSYLEKKTRWAKTLFVFAGICEVVFFLTTLYLMDFENATHKLIVMGLLFVYTPVIILVYRNSVQIDRLYYRIVEEMKYGGQGK